MEQTTYETPIPNLDESRKMLFTTPIIKPWGIYLVAIWCFFGIGGFTNPLFKSLMLRAQDSSQLVALIAFLYIGVLLGLIVGTLKMNRFWLISCAVLVGLIGIFQLITIGTFILAGQMTIQILSIKLFYAIPSFICAWYCARPSLLELASNYTTYKKQLAMQKYVKKQLVRGKS